MRKVLVFSAALAIAYGAAAIAALHAPTAEADDGHFGYGPLGQCDTPRSEALPAESSELLQAPLDAGSSKRVEVEAAYEI